MLFVTDRVIRSYNRYSLLLRYFSDFHWYITLNSSLHYFYKLLRLIFKLQICLIFRRCYMNAATMLYPFTIGILLSTSPDTLVTSGVWRNFVKTYYFLFTIIIIIYILLYMYFFLQYATHFSSSNLCMPASDDTFCFPCKTLLNSFSKSLTSSFWS